MELNIIIPTFNEKNNIGVLLEKIFKISNKRFYMTKYDKKLYRGIVGSNKALEIQKTHDKDNNYCFLYTGMGSNYLGMARDLLEDSIGSMVILRCHKHLESIDKSINL